MSTEKPNNGPYPTEIDQQLADELKARQIADNLVSAGKQLVDGLVPVPVKKIMEQCQYLQNHVLPQALQKMGEQSESYQFYKGLVDSLLWCLLMTERAEFYRRQIGYEKSASEFFRAESIRYREELAKYQLIEDGLMNMPGFQKSFELVRERLNNLIN